MVCIPPHDCRSRGDCGRRAIASSARCTEPPHDCRSRGDCGPELVAVTTPFESRLTIAAVAATAAIYDSLCWDEVNCRLTIAAVAATAAHGQSQSRNRWHPASRLPQSRRLRPLQSGRCCRGCNPASRLPQSRRLRPPNESRLMLCATPPHDCRSRGDCGLPGTSATIENWVRLTIAAVAATAAVQAGKASDAFEPASRLPQSRRLRHGIHGCILFAERTASRLPQSRRLRLEYDESVSLF